MKRLTIDEIHSETLRVLKVIHEFCAARNIRYMLHGGTLIGAIRHKGFIPWDDDADVSMPRPDYERFIREFPDSEEYAIFSPLKGNCWLVYSRLCDMKRTSFRSRNAWCNGNPGIGVDIFPLDGFDGNDLDGFASTVKTAKELVLKSWDCRIFPWNGWCNKTFREKIRAVLVSIAHPSCFSRRINRARLIQVVQKRHHELLTRLRFEECDYCAQLCNPNAGVRELLKKSWIDEIAMTPFEGLQLNVPRGYHEVLTQWFGDYMKLPPEDQRVDHTGRQWIVWR